MRQTHTYAVLPVSKRTYDEIHAKLAEAGYQQAFQATTSFKPAHGGIDVAEEEVIDMHGIALAVEERKASKQGAFNGNQR